MLNTVQFRPPKIGTTKEYASRRIAPEIPGAAASQKSLSVGNAKPILGSSTTITLQTIQTANDKNKAGMERIRLRKAIPRPVFCQKASSSGRQFLNQRPPAAPAATNRSLTIRSRRAGSRSRISSRSPLDAIQVQIITPARTAYISIKALLRTPVASTAIPNMIGSVNPPSPPITPTKPPTEPIFSG